MTWRAILNVGMVPLAGYLAVRKFHFLSDPSLDWISRAEPIIWGGIALVAAINFARALQGRRGL